MGEIIALRLYVLCVGTLNNLWLRKEKDNLDRYYLSVSIINLNLGENSINLRKLCHMIIGEILLQMYLYEA